jgi:hypothetical protein
VIALDLTPWQAHTLYVTVGQELRKRAREYQKEDRRTEWVDRQECEETRGADINWVRVQNLYEVYVLLMQDQPKST